MSLFVSRNPNFFVNVGLDSSMNLKAMFGDVKFVCMGGSAHRMHLFGSFFFSSLFLQRCT
jgi:hypothetical protein